jgi:hypothetical protein
MFLGMMSWLNSIGFFQPDAVETGSSRYGFSIPASGGQILSGACVASLRQKRDRAAKEGLPPPSNREISRIP